MLSRSTTPLRSCSLPIGSCTATTSARRPPAGRATAARSRRVRGRACCRRGCAPGRASAARFQRRSVWTSTPITELTTMTAVSTTRSDGDGVGQEARVAGRVDEVEGEAAAVDVGQAGREAELDASSRRRPSRTTVVPSSTLPSRVTTPASYSSASSSDVLPVPRWPTRATFLILLGSFIRALLDSSSAPGAPRQARAVARVRSEGEV